APALDDRKATGETIQISGDDPLAPRSLQAPFQVARPSEGPREPAAPIAGAPWSGVSAAPISASHRSLEHTLTEGLTAPVQATPLREEAPPIAVAPVPAPVPAPAPVPVP